MNFRYDSQILFRDLNNETTLNVLNDKDRRGLWVPTLDFINSIGCDQTVLDGFAMVVLQKESPALNWEDYSPKEGNSFFFKLLNRVIFCYFSIALCGLRKFNLDETRVF